MLVTGQIAAEVDMDNETVDDHLDELRDAGIVHSQATGTHDTATTIWWLNYAETDDPRPTDLDFESDVRSDSPIHDISDAIALRDPKGLYNIGVGLMMWAGIGLFLTIVLTVLPLAGTDGYAESVLGGVRTTAAVALALILVGYILIFARDAIRNSRFDVDWFV